VHKAQYPAHAGVDARMVQVDLHISEHLGRDAQELGVVAVRAKEIMAVVQRRHIGRSQFPLAHRKLTFVAQYRIVVFLKRQDPAPGKFLKKFKKFEVRDRWELRHSVTFTGWWAAFAGQGGSPA
jgi:hypothetical protein